MTMEMLQAFSDITENKIHRKYNEYYENINQANFLITETLIFFLFEKFHQLKEKLKVRITMNFLYKNLAKSCPSINKRDENAKKVRGTTI